jgi:ubiquinone biosynthesis protein UbiJ
MAMARENLDDLPRDEARPERGVDLATLVARLLVEVAALKLRVERLERRLDALEAREA